MMPFLGFTGNWGSRGRAQVERLADLARKCGDLTPLGPRVRDILVAGNRERSLAGKDVSGENFVALAPSTLARRKGTGPPLAPRGASSREVTAYEVELRVGPGRLDFIAGWPSLPWMNYHILGVPERLPRRDPSGFRVKDLEAVRALLREHYQDKRRGG
jgi:hypothetical protein